MTSDSVALGCSQRRHVAIYARVSTSEQTVEPQLHALRTYAGARGLEIAAEYVDHGISGAKDRRPALDGLLADARRRRFDVLACMKLVHTSRAWGERWRRLGLTSSSWTKPSTRPRRAVASSSTCWARLQSSREI
jgi:hypothetical protein